MSEYDWTKLETEIFQRSGIAPPAPEERRRRARKWRADRERGYSREYRLILAQRRRELHRLRLLKRHAPKAREARRRFRLDRKLFPFGTSGKGTF